MPLGGFFEGGEAERAPACPVFDEGGFAAFEVGGGGGAVGCRQGGETLRQILQGLDAAWRGGGGQSRGGSKGGERQDKEGMCSHIRGFVWVRCGL